MSELPALTRRAAVCLLAVVWASLPARSQVQKPQPIGDIVSDIYTLTQIQRMGPSKEQVQQLVAILREYHDGDALKQFVSPEAQATLLAARDALARGERLPDEAALQKAVIEVAGARRRSLRGPDGVGAKIAAVLSREQFEAMRKDLPQRREPAPRRLADWIESTIRKLADDKWKQGKSEVAEGFAASYLAPRNSPDFEKAVAQASEFLQSMRAMSEDEFNLLRPKLADEVAKLIGWDAEKNQPGAGRPVDPAVLEAVVAEMLGDRFLAMLELRLKNM